MAAWKTCSLTMLVALASSPLFAQSAQDIPRFNGSKSEASSAGATKDRPQTQDIPAPGAERVLTPQALVGAAALEAAREEGRIFIDERHRSDRNILPD